MRKLIFFAFCLLTGSLQAQTVTSKCGCDTLQHFSHRYIGNNEFLQNGDETESYYIDYTTNTITDEKGHFYTFAYDIKSTKELSILFFNGLFFQIHYKKDGITYIGHQIK